MISQRQTTMQTAWLYMQDHWQLMRQFHASSQTASYNQTVKNVLTQLSIKALKPYN